MIFDNIEFHNVEELEACEKGYHMWRLPKWVRENINEKAGKISSGYATGVELRFKMKSDKVTLFLSAENMTEATVAYIYYGSIQGGWADSTRVILTQKTAVEIRKPNNVDVLKHISKEQNLSFDPEVVRVILPLMFTDGLEFLDNPAYIAQDMVHPSLEGIEQIKEKWYEILREYSQSK